MPMFNGSQRFSCVLFDLGATLLYFDSPFAPVLEEASRVAARMLSQMGGTLNEADFARSHQALTNVFYQKRDVDQVEYSAAFMLREALKAYHLPDLSEPDLQRVLRTMYAVSQAHWQVEPDALSTLAELQASGYRMGIVSNAADDTDVQTLVDQSQLRPFFDFILTSARAGYRKPSPRIFRQALAHWGAEPRQTVMIGDTISADVAGANALGMASIWIKRRADTPENRAAFYRYAPSAVVNSLAEIPALLRNWSAPAQT